jgi:hypothetical protein
MRENFMGCSGKKLGIQVGNDRAAGAREGADYPVAAPDGSNRFAPERAPGSPERPAAGQRPGRP